MPRTARVDVGQEVYHILNRANARVQIFDDEKDYEDFEKILREAVDRFEMRLLAYCVMPNHWHLVVYPKQDGDLAKFMGWLTNTHTRRWHATKCNIAQDWRWSSIWRRENGSEEQQKILSEWPVDIPKEYLKLVNRAPDKKVTEVEEIIDVIIEKGNPFGAIEWVKKIVKKFGLEQTLRRVGRPRK